MEIKRKFINVFYDLNTSKNGLLAFTLYNRYALSAAEVVTFIKDYKEKGFISCDKEFRIKITEAGCNALLELKSKLKNTDLEKSKSKYFEKVSTTNRIEINQPYIPDVDFLRK